MPAVDTWLLAKPSAQEKTFDGAAQDFSDPPAAGHDFDSVMQATLGPQTQKASAKNLPRTDKPLSPAKPASPNTASTTTNVSTAAANGKTSGTKLTAVAGDNGNHAGQKSKSTSETDNTKISSATGETAATPVLNEPLPAFLSSPLFFSGSFSMPATAPANVKGNAKVTGDTQGSIPALGSANGKQAGATVLTSAGYAPANTLAQALPAAAPTVPVATGTPTPADTSKLKGKVETATANLAGVSANNVSAKSAAAATASVSLSAKDFAPVTDAEANALEKSVPLADAIKAALSNQNGVSQPADKLVATKLAANATTKSNPNSSLTSNQTAGQTISELSAESLVQSAVKPDVSQPAVSAWLESKPQTVAESAAKSFATFSTNKSPLADTTPVSTKQSAEGLANSLFGETTGKTESPMASLGHQNSLSDLTARNSSSLATAETVAPTTTKAELATPAANHQETLSSKLDAAANSSLNLPISSPVATASQPKSASITDSESDSGADLQVKTADLTPEGSQMKLAEDAGTGVAITPSPMKNQLKANKVAGPDAKVLPVGQNSDAREKNLPPQLLGTPVRATENRSSDLNFSFSNGNSQAAVADSTPVSTTLDLPSLTDVRMRMVDRTHDMMAVHSMRLVESKSDTLSVVLKPSVGTEISLELHQGADGVEAQATLTRGDHQFLNQHWADLQQRLELRGIKLAPLAGDTSFMASDNGQYQQQRQASEEEVTQHASAFAEFAATTNSGGATARAATVHEGWESWA